MRLVFMGSPELAVPSLRALLKARESLKASIALVVTQPDRPAGRGLRLTPSPVASLAASAGLPLSKPEKMAQAYQAIAEARPDYMIVVAFGQILPPEVLALGPAINLHASLLPAYRGAAPINRAIMDGAAFTGLTTMLINQGLDTGPILLQQTLAIEAEDTALSLSQRMAEQGAELLLRTLAAYAAGQLRPQAQDEAKASYARRLSRQDALLNWQESAWRLSCRLRALYPWPGSLVNLPARGSLKLFPPVLVLPALAGCRPGDIVNHCLPLAYNLPSSCQDYLLAACRDGVIGLAQAQAPGKRKQAGALIARWLRAQGVENLQNP
jgi:methionyl-tRNA formyltransferase